MLNCPYCGENKNVLVQLPIFIHTEDQAFVSLVPDGLSSVMCTECVEITKEALEGATV